MFSVGKNDTLPVVESLLSNDDGYIDLSNSTGCYFIFQPKSKSSQPISGLSTIVGPTSGHVRYTWTSSGLSNPGFYYGQFQVYFSGNNRITFPNDGFNLFSIQNSL